MKCPICSSNSVSRLFDQAGSYEHGDYFDVYICDSCGVFITDVQCIDVDNYYESSEYYGNNHMSVVSLNKKNFIKYGYLTSIVEALNKQDKQADDIAVLDFGSGDGAFLSTLPDTWERIGVDVSRYARKHAKQIYDLSILDSLNSQKFKSKRFDLIIAQHSLEHVIDPRKVLEKLYKLLEVSGHLVVVIPNTRSLGFSIFKERWWQMQLPKHIYHFNDKNIADLICSVGFKHIKFDHQYFNHNYYSIFQSFRYYLTHKNEFGSQNSHTMADRKSATVRTSISYKDIFVLPVKFISLLLALLGQLIHRSEVIIIIAKK